MTQFQLYDGNEISVTQFQLYDGNETAVTQFQLYGGNETAVAHFELHDGNETAVTHFQLYDLGEIAKLVELPGAFIVGAGAGPLRVVGVNSELICSLQVSKDGNEAVSCNSHTASVDTKVGSVCF